MKGIYNAVADAIFQLHYNPTVNLNNKCNHAMHGMSEKEETITKWKTFKKLWHCYNEYKTNIQTQNATKIKCFQIIEKKRKSFLLPHKRLLMLKEQIANSSIASSATRS
jgi:hypothetical protein